MRYRTWRSMRSMYLVGHHKLVETPANPKYSISPPPQRVLNPRQSTELLNYYIPPYSVELGSNTLVYAKTGHLQIPMRVWVLEVVGKTVLSHCIILPRSTPGPRGSTIRRRRMSALRQRLYRAFPIPGRLKSTAHRFSHNQISSAQEYSISAAQDGCISSTSNTHLEEWATQYLCALGYLSGGW